jgi:hypothetical protein
MVGYATGYDTAFGMIGRNPKENVRTYYALELIKTMPTPGAAVAREGGR